MARPIDADALFAEFENVDWYNNADRDEIAERLVLQAPTIDAVEVVRCRECKKWFEYKGINFCYRTRYTAKADDFCNYGEREGE
ncbi:MAG: hypothetical protein U0K87_10545 [Ruminococcus sp.]|nr:hypothetical protein [Ruminococcus sp.]